MLETYRGNVVDRAALGIPPLPLSAEQTAALCELLKNPPTGEAEFLVELLRDRVPPGVDQAAYVKAGFLTAVAQGETTSPLISARYAVELLDTMMGGYNVHALIELLKSPNAEIAATATAALSKTLLVYDAFHDLQELAESAYAAGTKPDIIIDYWIRSPPRKIVLAGASLSIELDSSGVTEASAH
jgi:aconitate hydratase 2 / 2-methylisocitrate dehydratase